MDSRTAYWRPPWRRRCDVFVTTIPRHERLKPELVKGVVARFTEFGPEVEVRRRNPGRDPTTREGVQMEPRRAAIGGSTTGNRQRGSASRPEWCQNDGGSYGSRKSACTV
jgi:hypothetical protein